MKTVKYCYMGKGTLRNYFESFVAVYCDTLLSTYTHQYLCHFSCGHVLRISNYFDSS